MKHFSDSIISTLKALTDRDSAHHRSPQLRFPKLSNARAIKDIDLAYLLGRDVTPLQTTDAHSLLRGKVVLVTGAAGSIGSELCRQLLLYEPQVVIALDNNETGLFDLAQSLHSHPEAVRLHPHICNITDVKSMARMLADMRPHIIFHAAAYKHVPLLEYFPDQAIGTNILATYHLCCLAQTYEVARFVFISTDKAAEPTSVMGASKRIGEMIIQSLAQSTVGGTCFSAVRFGNVIGSRGSVVPIFTQQISQGGPVTVTDPHATRYFMTIPEACGLVILVAVMADGGGLYLLDMGEPVRIIDLAIKMIHWHGLREGYDISIHYTGLRPGEHIHETLVGSNEALISTSHGKIFNIGRRDFLPAFSTLAQWMDVLAESLHTESNAELRNHLLTLLQNQDVLVTS